jgi:hypothetical protein
LSLLAFQNRLKIQSSSRWCLERPVFVGHSNRLRQRPGQCGEAGGERPVGGAAAGQFGIAFVNAASRPLGFMVASGARVLQAVASIGQTMLGLELPGRPLSPDEIKHLKQIYGNSFDYGLIRIKPGGPLNNAMADHTVGNAVYMISAEINPNGTLTTPELKTLSDEVGHVREGQNGGGGYIGNALFANLWYGVTTGNRNNGYPLAHRACTRRVALRVDERRTARAGDGGPWRRVGTWSRGDDHRKRSGRPDAEAAGLPAPS